MLELLSLFESLLKIISTIISTGFSVKKLIELKNDNDLSDENIMFVGSLIIGFIFGILWSYLKR